MVPVPEDWERLDAVPDVPFVARQITGEWFRVNVAVALDHGGYPPAATQAGAHLASRLVGGVLIDARGHHEDVSSHIVLVAHATHALDVVTAQRQLRTADTTVAVSYTCAVEQFPDWQARFDCWLDRVEMMARR